jgi:DeoR/GlpR family transcriptional regulator of sugar metabolism
MSERAALLPSQSFGILPASPAEARRHAIYRLITRQGFVSVSDLAKGIGISDMTVRRDLEALVRDGLVRRSHGGATSAVEHPAVVPVEPSFAARRDLNRQLKRDIAAAAAAQVQPGDVVGLDIGSTVACLAAELAPLAGIEIVTNSMQAVLAMSSPVQPEVFMLGGQLRPREGSLCGSITRQQLAGHWMCRVFLGASGIDEHGIYDYAPAEAEVKGAFIQRAEAVTVLCDSSKFGRRSFVRVCDFTPIGTLITDAEPPEEIRAALEQAGTEIIIAPPRAAS